MACSFLDIIVLRAYQNIMEIDCDSSHHWCENIILFNCKILLTFIHSLVKFSSNSMGIVLGLTNASFRIILCVCTSLISSFKPTYSLASERQLFYTCDQYQQNSLLLYVSFSILSLFKRHSLEQCIIQINLRFFFLFHLFKMYFKVLHFWDEIRIKIMTDTWFIFAIINHCFYFNVAV